MSDDDAQLLADKYRSRVEQELAELTALIEQTADAAAPVELDQQSVGRLSRMDAMQGQAMAEAAARRRVGQVARLRRTLARMDDGEFGYCTECGERIPDGRLDVDPTNHLCVGCAGRQS